MNRSARGSRWKSNLDHILNVDKPFHLLNTDRGYMARLYAQLGFTIGAEIGVGGGYFSEMICQHNPGVLLFAVDAWKPYEGYDDFTDPNYLENDYKQAVQRLEPYGVEIVRQFSENAVKLFDDDSLDFVYIDANHKAPYIADDIREWSKKVVSGGLVSGHDYIPLHMDVIEAVNHHVQRPLFLVGDQNERGDNERLILSWFWVKR